MRRFGARTWGPLLMAAGALSLLHSLGVLKVGPGLFRVLLLASGGLIYLYIFSKEPDRWWMSVPVGMAALLAWGEARPQAGEAQGLAFILIGIGVAFCAVCSADHRRWWNLAPGGMLLTIALVIGLSPFVGFEVDALFYLGAGLILGLIWLTLPFLPSPKGWTQLLLMLAAMLLTMGLLLSLLWSAEPGGEPVLVEEPKALDYLWPATLILVGLYSFARSVLIEQQSA